MGSLRRRRDNHASKRWIAQRGTPRESAPVYCRRGRSCDHPAGGGLVAVDPTGTEQWVEDKIEVATEPVLVDGKVLLGDGRTVRAMAAANGTERWSFETRERNFGGVLLGEIDAASTVVNGVVLVATNAGDVYALGSEWAMVRGNASRWPNCWEANTGSRGVLCSRCRYWR
ncbi:outer membrane protein assembly factor BamB family protein [Natrarchaeobius chitinivorans]|uniref:outer membrane protein assembly factor BamB family protein n=1 Tax=Natrarchaeobius chitinivorans TaxID=1679083 RepID=UPI001404B31A